MYFLITLLIKLLLNKYDDDDIYINKTSSKKVMISHQNKVFFLRFDYKNRCKLIT